ncbi:MAG: hypothetical protein LC632_03035 [Xanthomonadaceae bacterium]|nr:hypothetical protein [Xanthomonadaceae bacterium]
MRNLSNHESGIWSSLFIIVLTSVYFFSKVLGAMAAGTPLPVDELYRLGLALVFIIVAAEIALQVTLAIACRKKERTDERDALIAAKGARNAYYVLVTGLALLGGHAALNRIFGRGLEIDLSTAIVFVLLALVIAEIFHFASQLYYYRRGV